MSVINPSQINQMSRHGEKKMKAIANGSRIGSIGSFELQKNHGCEGHKTREIALESRNE